MNKYFSICFLFLITIVFSQDNKSHEFYYQAPHFFEKIILFNNGTFKYSSRAEFIKEEIDGNWKLKSDNILILNSYPKQKKIIVTETLKRNKKNILYVTDSQGSPLVYHLYLVSKNNDTLVYKDQFEKTIIKKELYSFFIENSRGVCLPVYHVEKPTNNLLNIKFERKRIFDNEEWKFEGNKIIPLGLDGKYSKYELKLNN